MSNVAYVDTSLLVSVAFGQRVTAKLNHQLSRLDPLCSSLLLEAELRAAFARESAAQTLAERFLRSIHWVIPRRPLTAELIRVLGHGLLRGADLYHVAHALFLSPRPKDIWFLTADEKQAEIAMNLGFRV